MTDADQISKYLDHLAWQFNATSDLKKRKADREAQTQQAKAFQFAADLIRKGNWSK